MIIDCIADLHGFYPKLEGGDLLIIAGDLTARDSRDCWMQFYKWMNKQKYKKIILIAGNHDGALQGVIPSSVPKSKIDFDYLCDSGTEFEYEESVRNLFDPNDNSFIYKKKIKIWGSPWTKTFEGMNPDCKAFTVDTEEELASKFSLIPEDIDILVTHSPPYGIFDKVKDYYTGKCDHVGSAILKNSILGFKYPKLKLHVFGHIHEHGGGSLETTFTKFVNASIVNEHYKHVNKSVRVVL